MKWPPASVTTSKIRLASALDAPQPSDASSPNVIAPRQTSDTRSPLGPRSRYFMSIGVGLSSARLDRAGDARAVRPCRPSALRHPATSPACELGDASVVGHERDRPALGRLRLLGSGKEVHSSLRPRKDMRLFDPAQGLPCALVRRKHRVQRGLDDSAADDQRKPPEVAHTVE